MPTPLNPRRQTEPNFENGHTRGVGSVPLSLVTGATGKVGRAFLERVVSSGDESFAEIRQRDARQFNICMDEPVDYAELGAYLAESRGLPTVEIRTPYHSTWLDNTKAKFLLGWRPRYDLERLVDEAWSYERSRDETRVVWYPG